MTKEKFLCAICLILFTSAVLCWVLYQQAEVQVDVHNILREPFGLIPVGWLCFVGAVVCGSAYCVLRSRDNRLKRDNLG